MRDERRNKVLDKVIMYISLARPKVFVLENVKGFRDSKAGHHSELIEQIEGILMPNGIDSAYTVYHKVVNSLDYGVPQSRNRVYYVGFRRGVMRRDFKWPDTVPTPPISDFLDPREKGDDSTRLPGGETRSGPSALWREQTSRRPGGS